MEPAGSNPPVVTGRGSFVPADVLTNEDVAAVVDPARLAAFVRANSWCRARREALAPVASSVGTVAGTSADAEAELDRRVYARFVEERVGIRERRVVDRAAVLARRPSARAVMPSHLGAEAARRALADAGVRADEIDVVVCGTSSPDALCPSTAVRVQAIVGAASAWAFDLSAACSSFVFALEAARGLVRSGSVRRALVVAAEWFTTNVDYADPESAYFFGDGAAAVVLESAELARGRRGFAVLDALCRSSASDRITTALGGVRPYLARLHADGAVGDAPADAAYPWFHQDGPGVYRDVVPATADLVRALLARRGLAPEDVRRWFFHQASAVMVDGIASRLGVDGRDGARIASTLDRYGNTSSAGVAMTLAEDATMEAGDLGCLVVFGGGYTLGATLLRRIGPA